MRQRIAEAIRHPVGFVTRWTRHLFGLAKPIIRHPVGFVRFSSRVVIIPDPLAKQQILLSYAEQYGLRVLVETGTYLGDMVEAMKDRFDRIYSIELDDDLFENAATRFASSDHVRIIHGDSGVLLNGVLSEINEPALFWLDGHYSGGPTARGASDTPVLKELSHIFGTARTGDVVIIDDAREFEYSRHSRDYPTLRKLRKFVRDIAGDVDIAVVDDAIRITPASQQTLKH